MIKFLVERYEQSKVGSELISELKQIQDTDVSVEKNKKFPKYTTGYLNQTLWLFNRQFKIERRNPLDVGVLILQTFVRPYDLLNL